MKEQWTPGCPRQQLPNLLIYNIRVSQESSHLILIVQRSNGNLVAHDNCCQIYNLQYASVSRVKLLDPDSTNEQWTPGCPRQQLPTLLTHNTRVSQEWSHLILIVWRSNGHLVALDKSCQLYLLIIYKCLKSEVNWSW